MESLSINISGYIRSENLLQSGQKVILAVSGGMDSMCMAHLFYHAISPEFRLSMAVAHLNHQLREEDSDADEAFVERICGEWGLRCFTRKIAVLTTKPKGESLENHARKLRYSFLRRVKKEFGADKIATAHTRSDQIETVYMRVTGGTGIKGLCGILPSRKDGVIRPLLCVSRDDIAEYARLHKVPFRHDKSNDDLVYLRNRVRHVLLPRARKQDPLFDEKLLHLHQTAVSDWKKLSPVLDVLLAGSLRERNDGYWEMDFPDSLENADHLARAFLGRIIPRPTRRHVEALGSLLRNHPGKCVLLPGKKAVWRTDKGFLAGKIPSAIPDSSVECRIGEECHYSGFAIGSSLSKNRPCSFPESSELAACLDADRTGQRWKIRTWKKGDTFKPLGMQRRKKVSDLLCESKVPLPFRKNVLVMETDSGIAWVVGYRIGEDFKIRDETRVSLRVYLSRTLKTGVRK